MVGKASSVYLSLQLYNTTSPLLCQHFFKKNKKKFFRTSCLTFPLQYGIIIVRDILHASQEVKR